MRYPKRFVGTLLCALFALVVGGGAQAAEKPVAEKILDIMKANGQISQQQYDELLKQAKEEAEQAKVAEVSQAKSAEEGPKWYDRLTFFGDFRGRFEYLDYSKDPVPPDAPPGSSTEQDSRSRGRYRARLGVKTKVNDLFDVLFRLASGNEGTSRNVSFGNNAQFGPDDIMIDEAYLTYHPFARSSVPLGGKSFDVRFGKVDNMFISKQGKDLLIWDGDITPEGGDVAYVVNPSDATTLTLRAGYYIDEENSSSSDPHVAAFQLQTDWKATDTLKVGGTISDYAWHSLNDDFIAAAEGHSTSTPNFGGLTDNSGINLVDFRAWVDCKAIADWPGRLYGNYLINTSAQSTSIVTTWGTTNIGKEDSAWSLGTEIGDKDKYVMLGVAYFNVEQNSTLRNMTDSDLFDAKTNRKGWAFYGARNLAKHVDFKVTLFKMDVLDKAVFLATGDSDADRLRLQTDIELKF